MSRLLLPLLVLLLGCQGRTTGERAAPTLASTPPAAHSAAPSPPVPWFQGEWHGGTPENAPAGARASAQLVIDAAGQVTGTVSLKMALTGRVDEDAVRVEAEGEGGHGVAVLRHHAGTLEGILHYAPSGAEQGARVTLSLTRGAPP